MSNIFQEVLAANQRYAADFGDKAKLAMPPARHFAILTCMDARLDPAKFAGLAEGDAHVIRNAGGRASDDAIRSLRTSCWAPRSGLSFTTRIAVWSSSPTT
jgi:carbonic anhydrase